MQPVAVQADSMGMGRNDFRILTGKYALWSVINMKSYLILVTFANLTDYFDLHIVTGKCYTGLYAKLLVFSNRYSN